MLVNHLFAVVVVLLFGGDLLRLIEPYGVLPFVVVLGLPGLLLAVARFSPVLRHAHARPGPLYAGIVRCADGVTAAGLVVGGLLLARALLFG